MKSPIEQPQRLPWEAHPEGGFIAYPEGKQHPKRFARITKHGQRYGAWLWSVNYDGSSMANIADDKQQASDGANQAWPGVVHMAKEAKTRSEWEAHQLDMIAAVERGEIGPEFFANDKATQENMMWVMDRIRPKPGIPGVKVAIAVGRQKLVDALSRELHKFRTGERK